jgi:hypothetical protein
VSNDWRGRIETYSGDSFAPLSPDPADVRLGDIAAGLAHTCRFGGQCQRYYSVAEHSLYVASELDDYGPRVQLYGLLHDAGEAYLVDVPRPIKEQFEGFEQAEAEIREVVWDALDVRAPTETEWTTVMDADDQLLAYEADELLADGSWAADPPARSYDLGRESVPDVRERFRARAERLLDAL